MTEAGWLHLTEQDWLNQSWTYAMHQHVLDRGQATSRKLRLFAVACCRRIYHLLTDDGSREAVEFAERFADGLASREQRERAYRAAEAVLRSVTPASEQPCDRGRVAAYHAASAAWWAASAEADADWLASTEASKAVRGISRTCPSGQAEAISSPERPEQAGLLRDLFGNPFRLQLPPAPSVLGWQDGLVVQLAQAAYDDRILPSGQLDPTKLALLADALTDVGHTDAGLIEHLREPGPHVRGCFAVDLVLAKS